MSYVKEIKFTISSRGQKMAFYWSGQMGLGGRWIRMKLDDAIHLIETKQAEDVTGFSI